MPNSLDEKFIEIRKLIESTPGTKLPGERELAEKLALSRPAIRSFLAQLESEGLVERRQGSGTYAAGLIPDRLQRVIMLIDEGIKLGNDPFFSFLLDRIQSYLQKHGIQSIMERFNSQSSLPFLEQGVIAFGYATENILSKLRPNSPPVVSLLLNTELPANRRVCIIELGDEKAGEEAAQYLFNAGYNRLIFLGNQKIPGAFQRLTGVKKRAKQIGIEVEFIDCPQNYNGGLSHGKQLDLSNPVQPGIIAANDWLALGLRSALAERNDKSSALPIVSFDGLSLTGDPSLNIHSLAVPLDNIAEDVVFELQRLFQSKTSVGRRIVYDLYWRENPE